MSLTIEPKTRRGFVTARYLNIKLVVLTAALLMFGSISAQAAVTLTPTSWNVVGIDSNLPSMLITAVGGHLAFFRSARSNLRSRLSA